MDVVKILLSLIFLTGLALPAAEPEEEYFLAAGTPLFRTSDCSRNPAGLAPQDMLVKVRQTSRTVFRVGVMQKYARTVQVALPDGDYWTLMDIEVKIDPVTRAASFGFQPDLPVMFAGILGLAAAMALLLLYFRSPDFRFRAWLPILSILLIQYGLVLYIAGKTANIMLNPVDDVSYYNIARQLSRLDFSGKWSYTVGLPLFYIPFALFSGGADFPAVHVPLVLFNALLAMPLLLCMAYLILRKLASEKTALWTLLFWFVMILFYHYRYYHSGPETALETYVMKSLPVLPTLNFSFSLYELYVFLGYNAVSDTLSCALIFSCLAFVLYMKKSLREVTLFAALFGLACLVRLNNILFAPLLAFALYLRLGDELRSGRSWIRFLAAGAVPFLLVVGCQLVINRIQWGGFLTSPYTLHRYEHAARGFMVSMLPFGISFLGIANHAYLSVGGLSLFFIPDRRNRILLTLWTVPLVLFFYGYPVIFTNATRFILPVFVGFIAALLMTGFFARPDSSALRIAAVLLSGIFLTAPAGSPGLARLLPWNWNLLGMTPSGAAVIRWLVILFAVVVWLSFLRDLFRASEPDRKRELVRILIFLASFVILFQTAQPYLTALLLAAAFLRAGYDAAAEIRSLAGSSLRPDSRI